MHTGRWQIMMFRKLLRTSQLEAVIRTSHPPSKWREPLAHILCHPRKKKSIVSSTCIDPTEGPMENYNLLGFDTCNSANNRLSKKTTTRNKSTCPYLLPRRPAGSSSSFRRSLFPPSRAFACFSSYTSSSSLPLLRLWLRLLLVVLAKKSPGCQQKILPRRRPIWIFRCSEFPAQNLSQREVRTRRSCSSAAEAAASLLLPLLLCHHQSAALEYLRQCCCRLDVGGASSS